MEEKKKRSAKKRVQTKESTNRAEQGRSSGNKECEEKQV